MAGKTCGTFCTKFCFIPIDSLPTVDHHPLLTSFLKVLELPQRFALVVAMKVCSLSMHQSTSVRISVALFIFPVN